MAEETKITKPVTVKAPQPPRVETSYDVWAPTDPTMPKRTISAPSPAEAKETYLKQLGVITCGHQLSVSETDADPS